MNTVTKKRQTAAHRLIGNRIAEINGEERELKASLRSLAGHRKPGPKSRRKAAGKLA